MLCLLIWSLVIIVITTLTSLLYYKWVDSFIPSIKGPPRVPFSGNVQDFRDPKTINTTLYKYHQQYGKNYSGYFLHLLHIFTMDAKLIELITTSNNSINKGRFYQYLNRWLGTGLLTSSYQKWHKRRKMITPAYHFSALDSFVEVFDKNGRILVEKLRAEVEKPETNIYPFINLCALDIICESAMGIQVNAQLAKDSEFVKATKSINEILADRSLTFFKFIEFTYKFTESYRNELAALKILHGYTMNIIKTRRDELIELQQKQKQTKDLNVSVDDFGTKKRSNFLDLLLKSSVDGQPLSNEDIREEVDTFMFEGHDTVSSAISFTLYLLSNHPVVQERLIEEQREVYGMEPNRQTTLRDLLDMKYLELVIKEALRLYPSVPIIVREISKELKYNDCVLRKGIQIVINVYALHRDPAVFPEPEKFIPERFSAENVVDRNPYAYIPFSAGHRNCIGQKFAMLEMKSTISKVIRNYELLPLVIKHEPHILAELILRSDNGVVLKLKNRDW